MKTIGIAGAGTMGRGIAQLFAQSGHTVKCFDAAEGQAENAVLAVRDMIRRGVEKGRITPSAADAINLRLTAAAQLSDLADCDVVIEAIIEELDAKQQLFAALEDILPGNAILATNTSSLLVSAIAAGCRRPDRVAGLHFFNPVPLMKIVEIIPGLRTGGDIVPALRRLIETTDHRPVIAADQPGFLVNHAGRGLYTEGLRLLEGQVAGVAEIDMLLREAAGFRMGPFELLDLTGLDVSARVMESIYEQFQQEPRFRPSSLVPPRVAAGLFGHKTKSGWYDYEGDRKITAEQPPTPPKRPGLTLWVDREARHAASIAALARDAGATLTATAPDADILIVQPWGADATTTAAAKGLDAARTVALDPLPAFGLRRTLMLTAITSPAARDAALALLSHDGVPVTVINDSPGFVVQRVLATIINIAANIAQRGIAAVADLEIAVQLGLGYPRGPLAWGDMIGAGNVLAILTNMQAATGDPRYRPSPWLQRRATIGVSLLTPEAPRAGGTA
jgi:3-hydroxybutyryl-CoA dehydrogenase